MNGASAAGTIRQAGGRHVAFLYDSLAYGPSSLDPKEHQELRVNHWKTVGQRIGPPDVISARDFRHALARFPKERPIVLWSGERWMERLFL
ncbi:MAG TPA: DUF1835 domain-containing protein, partial [Myxococcaceae bacterium]|nr:DUF1835 domain-containing protein [Myxococcaceae bacterium]